MKNYFVTKYPHGTFSWADVATTDLEGTKNFLTNLFGWTAQDIEDADYTMFYLDGKATAGASTMGGQVEHSFWGNFVTVDSVNEIAEKAKTLGAEIIYEPMDVMEAGRMVVVKDPQGAMINFWEPKSHIGAEVVNKVGAMGWNELYTNDVEGAKKFYGELLGWEFDNDAMGHDYILIKNNGRMNGGIMAITEEMGDMPPMWGTYFTVANVDEAVEKIRANGGIVHKEPWEAEGVGKMAAVAGPEGAPFMIIEMNDDPEEWEE